MASFYLVSPSVGNVFGTKSFMIVVLGGLGSIPGAIIGGLIFGLIEQVGAAVYHLYHGVHAVVYPFPDRSGHQAGRFAGQEKVRDARYEL